MLLVVNLGWRIIAFIILFLRSIRTKPSIGNFFRKLKQKKERSAIKQDKKKIQIMCKSYFENNLEKMWPTVKKFFAFDLIILGNLLKFKNNSHFISFFE